LHSAREGSRKQIIRDMVKPIAFRRTYLHVVILPYPRRQSALVSTVWGVAEKVCFLARNQTGASDVIKSMTSFSLSRRWLLLLLVVLGCNGRSIYAADEPVRREWMVDGVAREAMVYVPASAKTNAAPVVFVFHGHGGGMRLTERGWSIHTVWPEAIVVYPQGLNTPGKLTDPEGKKTGWQSGMGVQGDRDLKFFDAMLASLKADYKVDSKRLYATGHSNGGSFTYLLWQARGEQFAAFAPSAAPATFLMGGILTKADEGKKAGEEKEDGKAGKPKLLPKPFLHLGAENDPLVKFAWQKATFDKLREMNQCGEGKPWKDVKGATLYPSKLGALVVTYIHDGGHTFPKNGPAMIVKFFKEQVLP